MGVLYGGALSSFFTIIQSITLAYYFHDGFQSPPPQLAQGYQETAETRRAGEGGSRGRVPPPLPAQMLPTSAVLGCFWSGFLCPCRKKT